MNQPVRSTSGFCFFFLRALVSYKSKLQPFTTDSTGAAETVAASLAADEAVWLFYLCNELYSIVFGQPL